MLFLPRASILNPSATLVIHPAIPALAKPRVPRVKFSSHWWAQVIEIEHRRRKLGTGWHYFTFVKNAMLIARNLTVTQTYLCKQRVLYQPSFCCGKLLDYQCGVNVSYSKLTLAFRLTTMHLVHLLKKLNPLLTSAVKCGAKTETKSVLLGPCL